MNPSSGPPDSFLDPIHQLYSGLPVRKEQDFVRSCHGLQLNEFLDEMREHANTLDGNQLGAIIAEKIENCIVYEQNFPDLVLKLYEWYRIRVIYSTTQNNLSFELEVLFSHVNSSIIVEKEAAEDELVEYIIKRVLKIPFELDVFIQHCEFFVRAIVNIADNAQSCNLFDFLSKVTWKAGINIKGTSHQAIMAYCLSHHVLTHKLFISLINYLQSIEPEDRFGVLRVNGREILKQLSNVYANISLNYQTDYFDFQFKINHFISLVALFPEQSQSFFQFFVAEAKTIAISSVAEMNELLAVWKSIMGAEQEWGPYGFLTLALSFPREFLDANYMLEGLKFWEDRVNWEIVGSLVLQDMWNKPKSPDVKSYFNSIETLGWIVSLINPLSTKFDTSSRLKINLCSMVSDVQVRRLLLMSALEGGEEVASKKLVSYSLKRAIRDILERASAFTVDEKLSLVSVVQNHFIISFEDFHLWMKTLFYNQNADFILFDKMGSKPEHLKKIMTCYNAELYSICQKQRVPPNDVQEWSLFWWGKVLIWNIKKLKKMYLEAPRHAQRATVGIEAVKPLRSILPFLAYKIQLMEALVLLYQIADPDTKNDLKSYLETVLNLVINEKSEVKEPHLLTKDGTLCIVHAKSSG